MECGQDWTLNIAQGDPWNKRSVHVPKGRGPFNSWEEAAIDALSIDGTDKVKLWSVERLCYELENTTGSAPAQRASTPRICGATATTTARGKYVADHVWDANAVSGQAGAMPILSRMMALDSSITFGQVPKPPDIPTHEPAPTKPLIKSKSMWASVAAGITTAGGAFTEALGDWRVWCAIIVVLLLAYVIWERNGKPDIRGLVR
jgi:hypothetical protein